MADFLYFNGYSPEQSRNASDHEVNGQRIIEVWKDGRCLGVEFDDAQPGYEGVRKVVFFIDNQQIDVIDDIIPTDEQLVELLEAYG